MANKKNNKPALATTAAPRQQQQETVHGAAPTVNSNRLMALLPPIVIAAVTWLFYSVCLGNQFTNWDDPGYIRDNAVIKDISGEGIARIFSTSIMGNYHPLTILTYALEYSKVRLEPWLYHFDSLLFHVVVTLLVYWLTLLLSRRAVAAAVTALLFGLHPMHVESVAWIAGRKDVVYGAFYVAACIAHVYYIRAAGGRRWGMYAAVVAMFLGSLLSKPVAVILPVTLLAIDYWEQRKLSYKLLLEKAPLFILSIGFGIKSVIDQKAFGSLGTQSETYNVLERIGLGGYALFTYLWKAVAPVRLCCFYPYPLKVDGALPFYFYLYPLAMAALAFVAWRYARRNKAVVFGILFFIINIALLLQFIPVGGAILADRYTYIPYLGLFFIVGWLVSGYFQQGSKKQVGYGLLGGVVVYALVLGYMSYERCQVWYDTTTLWTDEIEKEPVRAPNAYNNLGFNYFNKFNSSVSVADKKVYFDSAYYLLNRAIELQPTFVNPYISLGELLRSVGRFPEAKGHYYKALTLKSFDEDANSYLGLAIIYAITRNFDSSAYCFRSALQLKPHFPEAHSNFGNFFDMTRQPDSALQQYAIAISQNPDMYAPFLNRGRLLHRLHRCDEAMKDFKAGMELVPENGEFYYARSFCYEQQGNKPMAAQDIEKAISLGFTNVDKNYYQAMKAR